MLQGLPGKKPTTTHETIIVQGVEIDHVSGKLKGGDRRFHFKGDRQEIEVEILADGSIRIDSRFALRTIGVSASPN